MKTRLVFLSFCVLLFSSCIVKSIQPYYIKSAEKYDANLIGKWTDNKSGSWEIASFKDEWEKEKKDNTKFSKEDLRNYENYKEGYVIKNVRKEKEALFIGIPFKVNEHLFVDFTPFEYDTDDLNRLAGQHLLKTHSTAYVEINTDNSMTLKWLNEKVMRQLLDNKKLRIKHEKTGIDEDLILTATSKELHEFLKKFMRSKIEDKWDNDVIYKLTPTNAKP